jgi:hypothetical protein
MRDDDGVEIELLPSTRSATPTATPPGAPPTPSPRPQPHHQPGRRVALGGAAVAVVAVGLLAFWPRSDDAATPDPTSVAPATTAVPPAPVTTDPVTTSPVPPTTIAPVNGRIGPVLGQPHGGSIALATGGSTGTRQLWRVDLDTGATERLLGLDTDEAPITFFGDRLIVGKRALLQDGSIVEGVDPERFLGGAVFPVAGNTAWVVNQSVMLDAVGVAHRLDPFGRVVDVTLTPIGFAAVGAFDSGVVVHGLGQVAVTGPGGVTRSLGPGTIVALAGSTLVWNSCDEQLRCATYAGTVDQPRRRVLPTFLVDPRASRVVLDPTGRRLAFLTSIGSVLTTLEVVDVRTGAVVASATSVLASQPAWSPDGRYVFIQGGPGNATLQVIDTQTGAPTALQLSDVAFQSISAFWVL